jgi:hypothetical protein
MIWKCIGDGEGFVIRRFGKLERLTPIDRTLVLKIGTGRGEDFSYGSHVFVTVFGFRNSS